MFLICVFAGFSYREIVAYSICFVLFAVLVILCIVCQRRNKQIYSDLKLYQTRQRRIHITDNVVSEMPLEETPVIYELIDESNMLDNQENIRDTNFSATETNGSYVQPDSNGYLTPYQPVNEYTNIDYSSDNKSGSSVSSKAGDHTANDFLSNSSSSDTEERPSSYLNPYQPIVYSLDIHEYSSTHDT